MVRLSQTQRSSKRKDRGINSGYQVVSKLDFSSKIAYDFLICPEKHKRRSIRKERP
jgi:hypothetical protein